MPVDWENLYKVRLGSSDESFQKHEIVKLLVVMKILQKHRRRDFLRIYTEFELENKKKPDIYVEDIKTKSILIYEIQKECDKKYIKETTEAYNNYEVYNFTVDLVIIPLKELSDNIQELNKQLDKYVV